MERPSGSCDHSCFVTGLYVTFIRSVVTEEAVIPYVIDGNQKLLFQLHYVVSLTYFDTLEGGLESSFLSDVHLFI